MAGLEGNLVYMPSEAGMQSFLLSSSKDLAELTRDTPVAVQFTHEPVRDFLVDSDGFKEISDSNEASPSHAHEQLKQCCVRDIDFEVPQYEANRTALTDEQYQRLTDGSPFAQYATCYILHHASQAAAHLPQERFLTGLYIEAWCLKHNVARKPRSRTWRVGKTGTTGLLVLGSLQTLPILRSGMKQPGSVFNELLSSEKNQYWFQLSPGKCLFSDNWRALHGRSEFTGKRRMCGGYVDRDDFISNLRLTSLRSDKPAVAGDCGQHDYRIGIV